MDLTPSTASPSIITELSFAAKTIAMMFSLDLDAERRVDVVDCPDRTDGDLDADDSLAEVELRREDVDDVGRRLPIGRRHDGAVALHPDECGDELLLQRDPRVVGVELADEVLGDRLC